MNFSIRLKELRTKNNLTQARLSVLTGIAERALRYYEAGSRDPSFDALLTIADYFSVSLDYLVGRSNNPKIDR